MHFASDAASDLHHYLHATPVIFTFDIRDMNLLRFFFQFFFQNVNEYRKSEILIFGFN